ncbi:MAG: low molecular weight phosphatase family protein [Methylotetracoccus sp.]
MQSIALFLCSGNYFRSRFAEIVFNHHAPRAGLGWRAESRGIAIDPVSGNIGPISRFTLRGLAARGIPSPDPAREPLHLVEVDLRRASRVIALKEAEHRPMIVRRFPGWVEKVEYWHIDDIDCAEPDDAMLEIERQVFALIAGLSDGAMRG